MNSTQGIEKKSSRNLWIYIFSILLSILIVFILIYRLNDWPKSFWDEGWTLDAASNWVNQGHLGHYLDGQPIPPRSPVRFPIVIPVALSMKLFGTGVWQGRLPGVIFTILTLGLLVYICAKVFNYKVGIAALIISLFLASLEMNPLFLGRTTLAEMPMMFYLFGGITMLYLALQRNSAWGLGAMVLFGISLHAKLQVPPFWLAAMILAIWTAIKYKQMHATRILVITGVGSIGVAAIVLLIQNLVMPGSLNDPEMVKILFNSAVAVFTVRIRTAALLAVFIYSLPQSLGLIWSGRYIIADLLNRRYQLGEILSVEEVNKKIIRAGLWGLGASWMVWYIAMAMMWPRYLFPPYFIGCIFLAAYLDNFLAGFDIRIIVRRTSDLLFRRRFDFINFQAIILIVAFSILFAEALLPVINISSSAAVDPAVAAQYIKNNFQPGTKVESFESELYVLLPEINFHYPPDLVSMQYVRKQTIDPQLQITYDPMKTSPEYLVIGGYARFWHAYDDTLAQGSWQLVADVAGYQIYRSKNGGAN